MAKIVSAKEMRDELREMHIDGFSNIFSLVNGIWLKITWCAILLVSASTCLFLIVKSVNDYTSYAVITKVRMENEYEVTFPAITLCNKNPFTTDYAGALFAKASLPNIADNVKNLNIYLRNTTGSYLNDDQAAQMSDLNDYLVACSFNSQVCNASHFSFLYHPNFFNCYRFNSGLDSQNRPVAPQKLLTTGYMSALTLDLYAGLSDSQNYNTLTRGISVFVHNQTSDPLLYSIIPQTLATPGLATTIGISRQLVTQFNQWPYKYATCTVRDDNTLIAPLANTSLFDAVKSIGYAYSRVGCSELCYRTNVYELCACNTYSMRNAVENASYCLSEEQKTCENDYQQKRFFNIDYFEPNCLSLCPLECTQASYEMDMATYSYPPSSLYTRRMFDANPTLTALRASQSDFKTNKEANLVRVVIYLDSLAYKSVLEEAKMTLDDLIGMIGGHLHLFMGMSLLSFVEIGQLLLKIGFYGVKEKNAIPKF